MKVQLVGAFGCFNTLTALEEADVGSSGPGSNPAVNPFTSMAFSTLQEINDPENSQVLSTVLITASGNDNTHVY